MEDVVFKTARSMEEIEADFAGMDFFSALMGSLEEARTNEKRLIDANALQLEPDPWGGMNGVLCLGRSGGKTMATVQAALKRMIDNAPTVDAVEVVRCCSCEKHDHDGATGYCNRWGKWTKMSDFCSYGERKKQ